jgi:hypothetical protein
MTSSCREPLSLGTLLAYWFGELDAEAERQVEEHFVGCAYCSETLEALAALGLGIRAVFETGLVSAILSPAFVERMKERGMKLREYPVAPGGTVNCTITAQDDAVISRLKAPLAGRTRIDVLRLDREGNVRLRYTDVPFDPAAGEVLVCPSASVLKAAPAFRDTMRLLAIDVDGEHALGDYIFDHTPS